MLSNINLIIDFDSTFVKLEAFDELLKIALKNNSNQAEIVESVQAITNLGMEARLLFQNHYPSD
ncbi:MAG: hypothetical protein M3P33_02935 [bacterium]|nr:hypothetical protein [bacterium]